MRNPVVHPHDACGNHLCNENLTGTFCPSCARAVLAPIVLTTHARRDIDRYVEQVGGVHD